MTNEKDRVEAYGLPTHYDDGDLVDDIREKKHGSYGTEFDLDYPIACARVRQYCARIRSEAMKAERETSWMIELRVFTDGPRWWTGAWGQSSTTPGCTNDPNSGVRFKRREDAEKVIALLLGPSENMVATEHMWPEPILSDDQEASNG